MGNTQRSPGRSWRDYVRSIAGDVSGKVIARRAGIHQTTISRWRSDEQPSVNSVIAFARGYGLNVLDALIESGYITDDEARTRPRSIRRVPTDELMRELARRAGEHAA